MPLVNLLFKVGLLALMPTILILGWLVSGARLGIVGKDQVVVVHEDATTLLSSPTPTPTPDPELRHLLDILRTSDRENPELVRAVRQAGTQRHTDALPYLINLLDFAVSVASREPRYVNGTEVSGTEIGKTTPLSGQYPAIEALFKFGQDALPALTEVIAHSERSSRKSQNALYTIRLLYKDDPRTIETYLTRRVKETSSAGSRRRILSALKVLQSGRPV